MISWCLIAGSRSIGLKRKSAKEVFFFHFSSMLVMDFFFSRRARKCERKLKLSQRGFGGFSLERKVFRTAIVNDTLFTFERARVCSSVYCIRNKLFTKQNLCLEEIQKGEWTNVNSFCFKITLSGYQNNNDLHRCLQLPVFKKELGSATGVERSYYLKA